MPMYEYLRELDRLLRKLPDEERREAMAWYEEYFVEAGPENEEAVIERLGSPQKVAAGIRADVAMKGLGAKDGQEIRRGISTVWVVLLSVFALPVGLPVAITVFALAFALLWVVIAVLIALYAAALALTLGGLAVFAASIPVAIQNIAGGMFYFGAGLILIGGGALLFILATWLGRRSLNGITRLIGRFRREKRRDGLQGEEVAVNV